MVMGRVKANDLHQCELDAMTSAFCAPVSVEGVAEGEAEAPDQISLSL